MKRWIFFLLAWTMVLCLAVQGCSESDEPGPKNPGEKPEPPSPVPQNAVARPATVNGSGRWQSRYNYYYNEFVYNEKGKLIQFTSGGYDTISVTWAGKQVSMKSHMEGGPKATFTLNDKGKMQKLVWDTYYGTEELEAEYTADEFKMYKAEGEDRKELFTAGTAAGDAYGDWSTVSVKNRIYGNPDAEIKLMYGEEKHLFDMPLFLMQGFLTLGMNEGFVWAGLAGLLPRDSRMADAMFASYTKDGVEKKDVWLCETTLSSPDYDLYYSFTGGMAAPERAEVWGTSRIGATIDTLLTAAPPQQ